MRAVRQARVPVHLHAVRDARDVLREERAHFRAVELELEVRHRQLVTVQVRADHVVHVDGGAVEVRGDCAIDGIARVLRAVVPGAVVHAGGAEREEAGGAVAALDPAGGTGRVVHELLACYAVAVFIVDRAVDGACPGEGGEEEEEEV